jgi:hypothetical protein
MSASRASALAPAAVGLALFIGLAEIRMDGPWGDGVLLLVAGVPALLLLFAGLEAERADATDRGAATVLLVAGLLLTGVAIARLGQVLGDDDFGEPGGTLTWMVALFTLIAAYCHRRSGSVACLLIAALAAVGLLLAAVHWVFDTDDIDVYRALLVFSFVVLFGAGLAISDRAGTVLVGGAGVTVLASAYVTGLFFVFFPGGGDLGWGWELVTLVQGAALAVYAVRELEPGPGYIAFFVFLVFVTSAAVSSDEPSLVGWPLTLAILTALLGGWATRDAVRRA